jgi:hypothetical protein
MPTRLARLADDIKADLAHRVEGATTWAEANIDLCAHLAEARAEFTANIAFGEWCEANGFGESVLNKDDRAAAIAMGQQIDAVRPVLQVTDRRSLRYIYKNECRFLHVAKTTKRPKKSGEHRKVTDEQAVQIARAVLDDHKTQVEASAMFGVSVAVAKVAVAKEQGRRESPPPDPSHFARTTKDQFDRAVRKAVADARVQIEAEVKERVHKAYDETFIPHAFAKAEYADEVLATRHGIMSASDFKKILTCLHPDTAMPSWKERCAEAFDLFKKLERLLIKPDTSGTPPSELPSTVGELLARRKKW